MQRLKIISSLNAKASTDIFIKPNTVKWLLTFILSMPLSSPLYMAGTQRIPGDKIYII